MKKLLSTIIFLIICSTSGAQNNATIKFNWKLGKDLNQECGYPIQKTSISVTKNSCVPKFLSYKTSIKKAPLSDECEAYYYIEITNNSKFKVSINFRWNIDSGSGSDYVKPGGTMRFESYKGSNSDNIEFIFNKVEFYFTEVEKKRLDSYGVYKVTCNETDSSVESKLLKLKEGKEKIIALKNKAENLPTNDKQSISNKNIGLTVETSEKNSKEKQSEERKDDYEKIKIEEEEERGETYPERLQRQEKERNEHTKKLAKERQEWANKQEADRIAAEKAGEVIGESVIAIAEMIDIKEADFTNNRLVLNYTLNKFNEINFGYSHRSVWGKFFWQIDFMASATYSDSWKQKQKINGSEDNTSDYFSELNELNNNIEEGDLLSTWQNVSNYTSAGINYSKRYYGASLYSRENIFSIGGGINTGFGFFIPNKDKGDFIINGLGHISMRTNQILSYGYKFGVEYQFEKIGFGLHYKNSSYSTNDETIILSTDESKFREERRFDTDINQTNYLSTNTEPDDFNTIIKDSSIELSIFILLN